ncbi:hypothetical protein LX16_1930 [Stackebrandtia albiflava]|uniref:PPE family protein n=1 Tax=Stackebrandtia albiflava TaxID=406432 RepID=A0A562VE92_9ACTN|nr:hypothetical protein [Stackebrandtia albiflava]TWJ16203.1 hypothetical protein LX16_1930 [Stackebrandtia albiflava]
MGDFDRYDLAELCDIVESDRPDRMREQAQAWLSLSGVLEGRAEAVARLRGAADDEWRGDTGAAQLSELDAIVALLREAAGIAADNGTVWHHVAHYAEYARDQVHSLRTQWTNARAALNPRHDDRYVPTGITVQVGDQVDETPYRQPYDQAARDVMELVAAETTELARSLRPLPEYTPPGRSGYRPPALGPGLGVPPGQGASAPGATLPGDTAPVGGTAPGDEEDAELQALHGLPGNPVTGMTGGGPGASTTTGGGYGGPMLSGTAAPRPGSSPMTVTARVASGGFTAPVLRRVPAVTPAPGGRTTVGITRSPYRDRRVNPTGLPRRDGVKPRRAVVITRTPPAADTSARHGVIRAEGGTARDRRRGADPERARQRRRPETDEDTVFWQSTEEPLPGVIGGERA